jgi:ABC-2 type transport system ATP-binding protein
MVRTKGLTKWFGKTCAVRELDLEVARGEFFGFLGPNGSGKSTTIKLLTTLLLPTRGSMEVAGHDVLSAPIAVKRVMGMLPEEIQTYERLSTNELIEFTGRVHGNARPTCWTSWSWPTLTATSCYSIAPWACARKPCWHAH